MSPNHHLLTVAVAALGLLAGSRAPCALAASVGAAATAAPAAAGTDGSPGPCGGSEEELARGGVVVVEEEPRGGAGVALRACGVIDAPPARVWPVVRDCAAYDRFMPLVEHSRLERRDGNVAICDVTLDPPFPLTELRAVTRVVEETRTDGSYKRHWTLLRGSYRRNDGSWTLLPWGTDGQRTLAVYRVDTDPDIAVPDFVLRRLQSATAAEVLEAIRARVRRCMTAGCD
jgi:ribosome-associated toxin RatA of RatAB toxin-antitoxin module